MLFSIRILTREEAQCDDCVLGEIRIDDFVERFEILPFVQPIDRIAELWRDELRSLLAGAEGVALQTASNMAWVLYHVRPEVRVRQQLFVPGWGGQVSSDGKVVRVPPYEDADSHDEPVSEWATTLDAVRTFLHE